MANKGSWRVSAEGNASGNGVINKSVDDVSGLMLVVTRSPGGLGRWHHSASYRRISPSPQRLNVFDRVVRLIRSFPILIRELRSAMFATCSYFLSQARDEVYPPTRVFRSPKTSTYKKNITFLYIIK